MDERDLPQDEQTDGVLVDAVNDAFDNDPIPPELTQFAFDAFQWRTLDEELAALAFDSATTELVGIRGTATSKRHSLRFEGRGISVSVSVTDVSFVASVEPPAVYRCRIEGPHAKVDVSTDADGQLAADEIRLPVRLVVTTPEGRLVSPWITA